MNPNKREDVKAAEQRLADFDQEKDYILPNGSPLATLATGLLLRNKNVDCVQTLVWDKIYLKYILNVIEL